MRVAQFTRKGGPLELVQRDIPEVAAGLVRVKVQACGVCHSDTVVQGALMPGVEFPRIPGHEVAGVIDAVGAGVAGWKVGQRVGIGWNGGYCGYCDSCRRGRTFACETMTRVTGVTNDGGYAEYVVTLPSALARIPDALSPAEAAPLLCAGLTTFTALRNRGARPGDCVAVLGLGGLGHLGVQFASKMGFRTVGIARGKDKESFARDLGAHHYIDNQSQNVATELLKLGGARVVLATATNSQAMVDTINGITPEGVLLVIGLGGPLQVDPASLILKERAVQGWYSGTSIDSQDTLAFSALTGVRSMNEVFPLDRAQEAYERMLSGKARFRAVLAVG
jgi:D-arabinose 1-dehydrogenase-like Zn-dependent alcohol dehydrogenase